jgi:hypothetical protein
MRVVDCLQGSPEWYAARAGIATASNFGDILARARSGSGEATTRRNYRARLVVERLAGKPVEGGFSNHATRQGQDREPMARDRYMVSSGNYVTQVGLCMHDTLECASSPDGLIDLTGGAEIKCPELSAHIDYLRRSDEPPEYRPQIQGNLWITGRQWWDFISFNPDFPTHLQLVVRRVMRDEKYITALELAVRLFMDEVRAEEAEIRALPVAA